MKSTVKGYFFDSLPPLYFWFYHQPKPGSVVLRKHEIKAIYDRGVDAVQATNRQLYEMIEVED